MWLVLITSCFIYSYQLRYMLLGKVNSNADLVYRTLLVAALFAYSFTIGISIPNDKFWLWNPYE